MSAFFLYSQANRTRVKEENGEASFGDIVSSSGLCSASASALVWFCCYFGVFYHALEVVCWVSIGFPIMQSFHYVILSTSVFMLHRGAVHDRDETGHAWSITLASHRDKARCKPKNTQSVSMRLLCRRRYKFHRDTPAHIFT